MPVNTLSATHALDQRIAKLHQLYQDTETHFSRLEKQIESDLGTRISDMDKLYTQADVAAFISGAATAVASVAKGAYQAIGKTGAELAKANAAMAQKVSEDMVSKVYGAGSLGASALQDEGTNEALKFLAGFLSPSYWYERFTGTKIRMEMLYQQAIGDVRNCRIRSLSTIKRSIAQAEKMKRVIQSGTDIGSIA